MEICAHITWEDGQVTEHTIRWCSDEPTDLIAEELSKALVDYLDEEEWPLDGDGILLAWVSVEVREESNWKETDGHLCTGARPAADGRA